MNSGCRVPAITGPLLSTVRSSHGTRISVQAIGPTSSRAAASSRLVVSGDLVEGEIGNGK